MEYQPLSIEKKEIRLLHLIANPAYATSAVAQGQEPNMIRLRMKTVSLDDFTPESRKYMEETGYSTYKKHFWNEKELSGAVIPTWETLEEKHVGLREIMATAAEAAEKPDWG
jgi:alpha-D-ribose 1-methylphosphonate 5-triphosphate diphosphatase PhnM